MPPSVATRDEIERSTLQNIRPGTDGARGTESPSEVVDRFGELSDAGAQHVIVSIRGARATPGRWSSSAATSSPQLPAL